MVGLPSSDDIAATFVVFLCQAQNIMEFCGVSLLFSVLLLLLLLLLFFAPLLLMRRDANASLPPGPWKLPVIGSLHHLLSSPLPHRSLAALAKRYGPVMHLQLGEVSTVVISSPAAAAEILRTQDVRFADRALTLANNIIGYGEKGVIFASYGSYWREMRKMCVLELFSAKRVRSFRSVREEEALGLVRSIASIADADSIVDLGKQLVQLTNDITARIIIGSKCKYQKEFLRIMMIGLQATGGFSLVDLFPSSSLVKFFSAMRLDMHSIHQELDMIVCSIIQEHRERNEANGNREEEPDLVDVMLKIQDEGSLTFPFTDESIKAIILELFVAGSETSATTVEWAMSELMRNPRVMKRAQQEVREALSGKEKVAEEDIDKMNYLKLVVKESLRLHPPAPLLLPRECREHTEIFGYQIPAKTRVLVNAWATARDPSLWEDAEEFKPERFEGSTVDFKGNDLEFIPFGAGRRMCAGLAFGLANVELPLACLLYYFDWKLPPAADELDMDEIFMLTSRRKRDLCLQAIPHIPCPAA